MKNLLKNIISAVKENIVKNSSFRFFDGGGYGINYKSNAYYFLDETGSFIIKSIINNDEIDTKKIALDFGIAESVIFNDFSNFLEQFRTKTDGENESKDIDSQINDETFLNFFTENKIPLTTIIEITEGCNEHCIHCYRPEPKKEYWTLERFEKICAELSELGALQIDFTGGEPFLKKGFKNFLEIADSYGFIISILTNATLITEEDIELLSRIRLRSLYISLYSANSSIHDSVTNLTGSFDKTISTIQELKTRGLPVFINSPIMDLNKNCLVGIKKLVSDLGLDVKFTYKISESYSKKRDTKKLNIFSKEEMQKMISNQQVMLYSDMIEKKLKGGIQTRNRVRSCDTGFRSMTISPEGDIIPCTALRMKCGNVVNQSVKKIWVESKELIYWREEGSLVRKECKTCDSYDFCEPCPAGFYSKNGSLNGVDDITCTFGKTFSSCVSCN